MKMRKPYKIAIKQNIVKMMQIYKYEMKEVIKSKTFMKKDKNAIKIITEAEIQAIVMKTDYMIVMNITIKGVVQRLIVKKNDVTQTKIIKKITKEVIVTMKEKFKEIMNIKEG